jgi:hypothetical protein
VSDSSRLRCSQQRASDPPVESRSSPVVTEVQLERQRVLMKSSSSVPVSTIGILSYTSATLTRNLALTGSLPGVSKSEDAIGSNRSRR